MKIEPTWLSQPQTQYVIGALLDAGYQARFVGGCVRDAVLGIDAADIDIATSAVPGLVIGTLKDANIKAIPTGISHGTITAVYEGHTFEITTLRKDVSTDGRHAQVAYSTNWQEDAARRDFTMNALYADRNGKIFDPLDGLDDLVQGQVRFIGCAKDRITEDYLRILRFFRFHAWYGKTSVDAEGLTACQELKQGLTGLSRERIGTEIKKLMAAPYPVPVLTAMEAAGISQILFGAALNMHSFMRYMEFEEVINPLNRMISLFSGQAGFLKQKLRLSNAEEQHIINRVAVIGSEEAAAPLAYRFGYQIAYEGLVLSAAIKGHPVEPLWQMACQKGASQKFPLKAKDFIELGVSKDARLGKLLSGAEELWIRSGFALSREELLDQIMLHPQPPKRPDNNQAQ